ncbi:hypothetical protein HELRODRAFT_108880 [Helobdella robusta]|uniref:Neutral ceramidase n=1 Tax=Helobdella robusta TaxID=6412 RepID=T1EEN3_HELRO|nr:hypothetical protein HELRODRAFT_108880 [Helobdella robusta]ESO11607.1 hypothetical protein HELRODRAFT_108880 [Helobdella robusta]
MIKLILILSIFLCCIHSVVCQSYRVGSSVADITGLVTEGLLYGYANPAQDARGMHTRQFSRAFVVADLSKTLSVVIVDVCMISQAVRLEVLEKLNNQIGPIFSEKNLMLLPTHSHSLPGGYHTYWMYQKASQGFINETYRVLVDGIANSIISAYKKMEPTDIYVNRSKLFGASVNRSPYAYYNNPPEEVKMYGDEETEKTMYLMKFLNKQQKLSGLIGLFGVHPVSLKNYNHLVSTDNLGYAVLKLEQHLNPNSFPGKGPVVTAIGQTVHGDSSPNLNGARCVNTDEFCSYDNSTCPEDENDPRLCTGRGPDGEQFRDSKIVGEKIFMHAKVIISRFLGEKFEKLQGWIDYGHQWVKMSQMEIKIGNKVLQFIRSYLNIIKSVNTCLPAMGYSFGAGATDGPALPPFTQGSLETVDAIEKITDKFFNKSIEEEECHYPKPILLPTGQTSKPYPWQPEILPLQIFKIGSLYLVAVPAEVTTMSGRRFQRAIKKVLIESGQPSSADVVVVSLANSYSSYLTTFEEYQVQRYEGASNIFGPHALSAYIQKFEKIARALVTNQSLPGGPTPPDLRSKQPDALGHLKLDIQPKGMFYGQVLEDVHKNYSQGSTVNVTFLSGNPRNNLMTDMTFLEVQKSENSSWSTKYLDSSWETKMFWKSACHDRLPGLTGNCTLKSQLSNVTISWEIPLDEAEGVYRIVHHGYANTGTLAIKYIGYSSSFNVSL